MSRLFGDSGHPPQPTASTRGKYIGLHAMGHIVTCDHVNYMLEDVEAVCLG
jgi:hypothetical protein